MTESLVSVVIPTYRRSETLERAIDSVLNQTYKNLEVIIVDDNQPDDEYSIEVQKKLRSYTDKRIVYVRPEKHINGCAARNAGIDASRGEYVAFLDDDDVWYPDKIEKQMAVFAQDDKIGLVYTGKKTIYVDDQISYDVVPHFKGDLSKSILFSNCIGTTSTVVIKKDVLLKAGKFDIELPARQDFDLWIRLCQLTEVGYVADIEIDYYNYRNGEQISSNTEKYEFSDALFDKKYAALLDSLSDAEKRKIRQNRMMGLAVRSLRNNDKKKGRYYMRMALKEGFDKKAFAMYLLSPFSYRLLLRLRKLF